MAKSAGKFWLGGGLLLAMGIGLIVSMDAPWAALVIALGASVAALPSLSPLAKWREIFAVASQPAISPRARDSLHLLRTFLTLSFIARREGILAWEEVLQRLAPHTHFMLRSGLEMGIDGQEPETVAKAMRKGTYVIAKRQAEKRQTLCQLGLTLLFIALTTALSGALAYLVRFAYGENVAQGGLVCLLIVSGIAFMVAAASLLLRAQAHNEEVTSQRIQRQIADGVLDLQQGATCEDIIKKQLPYLSYEERLALIDNPFSDIYDFNSRDDNTIKELKRDIKKFLCPVEEGGASQ